MEDIDCKQGVHVVNVNIHVICRYNSINNLKWVIDSVSIFFVELW